MFILGRLVSARLTDVDAIGFSHMRCVSARMTLGLHDEGKINLDRHKLLTPSFLRLLFGSGRLLLAGRSPEMWLFLSALAYGCMRLVAYRGLRLSSSRVPSSRSRR